MDFNFIYTLKEKYPIKIISEFKNRNFNFKHKKYINRQISTFIYSFYLESFYVFIYHVLNKIKITKI